MKKPPLWWLVCLCFCDCNCVYFKSSKLVGMKWQNLVGGSRDGKRWTLRVDGMVWEQTHPTLCVGSGTRLLGLPSIHAS